MFVWIIIRNVDGFISHKMWWTKERKKCLRIKYEANRASGFEENDIINAIMQIDLVGGTQ